MPRRPRLELPGVPLHVTHRGVNRAATFLDDEDFSAYRQLLGEILPAHGIAVHAYVLMTNHVHLLATPATIGSLSAAMCQLGRRYVPTFNRRHGRTGTLWEGRFKSCLVDSDRYVLTVQRYIELNPVRAAIAEMPEAYRWSSARASHGLAPDSLVSFHPVYLALGHGEIARRAAYRNWIAEAIDEEEMQAIRSHLQQERALGHPRFQAMVERTLNRHVVVRGRGRPRKAHLAMKPGEKGPE